MGQNFKYRLFGIGTDVHEKGLAARKPMLDWRMSRRAAAAAFGVALLLAGCGWGRHHHDSKLPVDDAGNGGTPSVPTVDKAGTVSKGNVIVGAQVSYVDAAGEGASSSVSGLDGSYRLSIPSTGKAPFFIKAVGSDGSVYRSIEFDTGNATQNINPWTDLLARITLQKAGATGMADQDFIKNARSITAETYQKAAQAVNALLVVYATQIATVDKALSDYITSMPADLGLVSGLDSGNMVNLHSIGLDNLLDKVAVNVGTDGAVFISVPGAPTVPPVVTTLSALAASSPEVVQKATDAAAAAKAQLTMPPVLVVVSSPSSWGGASAGNGYVGSVGIWTPAAVKNGWVLSFKSKKVTPVNESAWNADVSYDQVSNVISAHSLLWNGSMDPNSMLSFGFIGNGTLGGEVDLSDCRFNDMPCSILFLPDKTEADKAILDKIVKNFSSISTETQSTLTTQITGVLKASADQADKAENAPNWEPSAPAESTGLMLDVAVATPYEGGFGGVLTLTNNTSQPLPSAANGGWAITLNFGSDEAVSQVVKEGPWQFTLTPAKDGKGTATLRPQSWLGSVPVGATLTSGFGGLDRTKIMSMTSSDATLTFHSSTKSPSPSSSMKPGEGGVMIMVPPPPVPPDSSTAGIAPGVSGTAPSNSLFSVYKDVTVDFDWNTFKLQTKAATGTVLDLADALTDTAGVPGAKPVVALAFATGTCTDENWANMSPDGLRSNLANLISKKVGYVISTGGAAGAFNCPEKNGLKAFIDRYASSYLMGIDFDIEGTQTPAQIQALIDAAVDAKQTYPKIRYSFTIATTAPNNGGVKAEDLGDTSPDGLNSTGKMVVELLKKSSLTGYVINIMTMDYGSAVSKDICVVADGKCDMGQSAIQAAMNLKNKWQVPYSQIAVTVMLGGNDVRGEVFNHTDDVTELVAWTKANTLAGISFWSVDRDRDCPAPSPDAVYFCNSYDGGAGNFGFMKAFSNALR